MRRQDRTSGQLIAKSTSIKGAKRRSGDCAQKAAELTPGDLLRVDLATEAVERHPDRGAEVSRGHIRSRRRQGFQGTYLHPLVNQLFMRPASARLGPADSPVAWLGA